MTLSDSIPLLQGTDLDDRSAGARRESADALTVNGNLSTIGAIKRIFVDYISPRIFRVIVTAGTMAFVAAATGAIPFMMQSAADMIFKDKNEAVLYLLPPTVILVMLLRAAAEFYARVSQGYISNRIVADLRRQLFRKLSLSDIGWLQSTHSGKLVSVVMGDVEVVNQAAAQTIQGIAQNGLQVIFLASGMIYMDYQLAIMVLAALPMGGWLMRLQRRRAHRSVTSTLNEVGHLGAIVSETPSLDARREGV